MVAILKKGATTETIQQLLKKITKEVQVDGVDTLKYCGKIKLNLNPLSIQKKMRDEWE